MPFTPFHLGIGTLAKGVLPERTSLSAFALSQAIIDCETAYYLVLHDWPVHRWCHTFAVGIPIGALAGTAFWAVGRIRHPMWTASRVRLGKSEVSFLPAIFGGVLGGATHPVLDGIMHWDIKPFLPFFDSNPLLHSLGLLELHALCLALGAVGLGLLALRGKMSALYSLEGRD